MDNKDEEKFWYNVKQENGETVIEKIDSKGNVLGKKKKEKTEDEVKVSKVVDRPISSLSTSIPTYHPNYYRPKKKSKAWAVLAVIVLVFAIGAIIFVTAKTEIRNANKKNRTFMIYMVGSDLESNGSMATFDLNDINGANIDLNNNNVVLMVGGSKKWHNFVNVDEIGIYELTRNGFKKKKSLPVSSMGTNSSLSTFLDYSYDNYPADKYDSNSVKHRA